LLKDCGKLFDWIKGNARRDVVAISNKELMINKWINFEDGMK
jgi:hypothetical protein